MDDRTPPGDSFVGFDEALDAVQGSVGAIGREVLSSAASDRRALAADVTARVDSPSVDASLMDGFALAASDIVASGDALGPLEVVGASTAGRGWRGELGPDQAVSITTGAPVPAGADAVAPVEICRETGDGAIALEVGVAAGDNVLPKGSDCAAGETVAREGDRITPGLVGRLVAAGVGEVEVFARPKVALIGVGDELIEPGIPMAPGKVYASNVAAIGAWLGRFGFEVETAVGPDDQESLAGLARRLGDSCDVLVTSGGAWDSGRDMTVETFRGMGWEERFCRVRMGPGKGTAFGLIEGKPVFCLPGGPSACELSFAVLVAPCLMAMSGLGGAGFPILAAIYEGRPIEPEPGWTRLERCSVVRRGGEVFAVSTRGRRRASAISLTEAVLVVRDGDSPVRGGDRVGVLWLVHGD